mmetsp:Transcript_20240/g.30681  ORF Transcript_20240/g.30681 Transcript_20240/m.30681 type:complete len:157 (-) Transcript_20240:860-1330(-)
MASLELAAREKFDIPLARLSFALRDANDELLDSDEKLDSIPADKTTRVMVIVTRVGFSSILTVKEALQLLHQTGDSIPICDSVFPALYRWRKIMKSFSTRYPHLNDCTQLHRSHKVVKPAPALYRPNSPGSRASCRPRGTTRGRKGVRKPGCLGAH